MKEKNLVICDDDREFVSRLGGYISRREDASFHVACFSDKEQLREYVSGHEVDVLLAGRSWVDKDLCGEHSRWMVLAESEAGQEEASEYGTVYKYQAAAEILRQLTLGLELPGTGQTLLCAETKLFGVYAPGGWTESTRLALALARHLGREGPAVYIGLNEFSGVNRLLGKTRGQDLSDLAYCWRRGRLNEEQLERIALHLDGIDCIPAPANPAELAELKEKEAKELVEAVCQSGGYHYGVLDFGGSISGWLTLFGAARTNFVLFPDTETGSLQQAVYEEFWKSINVESIWKKSYCAVLPLEELRANRREKTEEYMNELAERLLQSAQEPGGGGGDPVRRGD